ADINIGPVNNTTNLTLSASLSTANNATLITMNNTGVACATPTPGCTRWTSASNLSVAASAGPVPIYLRWEKRVNGNNCSVTFVANSCWNNGTTVITCSNGGSNNCKLNPIGGTYVQRSFSYLDARSGPIQDVQVLESGVAGSNSFAAGTQHTLVVRVGVKGSLSYAASV